MCYSLWYNAPTMLPSEGRQHRQPLSSLEHELRIRATRPQLPLTLLCIYIIFYRYFPGQLQSHAAVCQMYLIWNIIHISIDIMNLKISRHIIYLKLV